VPFCPQCGVENPASARFCDQCGAVLVPVPVQGQATAAAIPVPAPVAAPAPAAPAPAPVAAGPSSCPQCGTAVIPGEAFCDNCGAALLGAPQAAPAPAPSLPFGGVPAQPSYPAPQPVAPTPPRPAPAPVAPAPPARLVLAPASLIVRASGTRLPLPAATETTLGRADPVSNFFPDIDLTPHEAINSGVGRRHARIFVQSGLIYAEDLDSTNGTFRNGARLAPRQPTPLANGDELRLGNLALTVQL
jgi:hypothetical protein